VTDALSVRSIVSSGSFADVQLFVTHFKQLFATKDGGGLAQALGLIGRECTV
jgi:hypothetical protein